MQVPPAQNSHQRLEIRWLILASVTLTSLLLYLLIVLPVERVLPWVGSALGAASALLFSGIAACLLVRTLLHLASRPNDRAKELGLLGGVLLAALLAADVLFTAYTNVSSRFATDPEQLYAERTIDEHLWDGELMPDLYFPTAENFWLYKPGQERRGTVYGEHYYTALSRVPLLQDSVLKSRTLEFVIDQYGLRNLRPPDESAVFVLGDSFAFGYETTQDAIFPELLAMRLAQPVYNLGVSGTSPMQQLLLLRYLLDTYPASFQPRHLIWLVFEGNDLEESYAQFSTEAEAVRAAATGRGGSPRIRDVLRGTVFEPLTDIPRSIRRQSVLRRLLDGSVEFAPGKRSGGFDHRVTDEATLLDPLYYSPRYGYRLFRQEYLDRAGMSADDVMKHPNASRLATVFHDMQVLAQAEGFDVAVVTVPSAVRLYKDYFEDLPPVSVEPHFIQYVDRLSEEVGFPHLDLHELMAPYAQEELLYYRDDTHWNERGHQVVAELLGEYLGSAVPE